MSPQVVALWASPIGLGRAARLGRRSRGILGRHGREAEHHETRAGHLAGCFRSHSRRGSAGPLGSSGRGIGRERRSIQAELVRSLTEEWPEARVIGHREVAVDPDKICPGYDVQVWLDNGREPLEEHIV